MMIEFSFLRFDPFRVILALLKLLPNSIKLIEKGADSMRCKVIDESGTYQKNQIPLVDTEIGTNPCSVKNLCRKFTREDD